MANKRRYISIWHDDNEWLASDPPTDPQELGEWHIAWAKLRKDCDWPIQLTDEIYNNQEDRTVPDWIDVTLHDEGVMHFKIARGVLNSIEGVESISFARRFFDVELPKDWKPYHISLVLYNTGGVGIIARMEDGYEEVEVNITEQFNQAIGEN